jgi:cytochrome b pre-mRNA-processing protein 3
MINYLKNRRALKVRAKALYDRAEAQARQSVFYAEIGVPDTVDGRFEMICLHCFILMRRLQRAGDKKLSQKLFDAFFRHMDLSLRELGVGDIGVPKHMKRMMQGFNGRANHYEAALQSDDFDELKNALVQNIYGTVDRVADAHVTQMANYVLANTTLTDIEAGFVPLDTQVNIQGKESKAHV